MFGPELSEQQRKLTVCVTLKTRSEQMISQRMFSSELPGTGLRERLSACRKRVRESRTIATAARTSASEQALETALVKNVGSVAAEAGTEMALGIEGQEVGIT
jgi:hypothetical protein